VRFGLTDLRSEVEFANALRADTPRAIRHLALPASADVTEVFSVVPMNVEPLS